MSEVKNLYRVTVQCTVLEEALNPLVETSEENPQTANVDLSMYVAADTIANAEVKAKAAAGNDDLYPSVVTVAGVRTIELIAEAAPHNELDDAFVA